MSTFYQDSMKGGDSSSPSPSLYSISKTQSNFKRSYTYKKTKFSDMVHIEDTKNPEIRKKLINTFKLDDESPKATLTESKPSISKFESISNFKKSDDFVLVPLKASSQLELEDNSPRHIRQATLFEKFKTAFEKLSLQEQNTVLAYLRKEMIEKRMD